MIQGFDFSWGSVVEMLMRAMVVLLRYSLEAELFQRMHALERSGSFDYLVFVGVVDVLREGVIV